MRWFAIVLAVGACVARTREPQVIEVPAGSVPLMVAPRSTPAADRLVRPFEITESAAGVQIMRHGAFCLPSDNVLATDEVSHDVARELESYPPKLLAAAHIRRVTLCARIDDMGVGDALGLADVVEDRILLDIHAAVDVVVPHELFHLVDLNAHYTDDADFAAFDLAWHYTNPPGFAYGEYVPHGFVDPYATTNALEDRASTFEYVMAHPVETCALARTDTIVRRKVGLIWARVAKILGDDQFLAERAPCLAALLHGD